MKSGYRRARAPSVIASFPRPSCAALLVAVATAAAALLLAACGDGGPTPEAGPTGTPAAPLPRTIDLAAEQADLTLWAADPGDLRSDLPALAAGDFNDDGIDDLVVGVRFGDGPGNSRADAGEAYVIFGSREPPSTVDAAADQQDVTVWGASQGDNLGYALHSGDVNGDGTDDILLGAPFASRPETSQARIGAVFVFFGSRDLAGQLDTAASAQDLTLWGPSSISFFGDSLASGDLNGDGVQDIIVGSTFAPGQGGRGQTGAAYVVFGSRDLSGMRDMAQGEYDFAVFGAEKLDELGDAVASGDVNGDGLDDLLVVGEAADGPSNDRPTAGEAYILYGSPDLAGAVIIGDGAPDVTLFGSAANDIFGFSIVSADADGDGIDDILVGARTGDGPGGNPPEAGRIYIVLGSSDLAATIDTALGEESGSIYGSDPADLLANVSVADADGDGDSEITVGSAYADGPDNQRRDAGEAYLIDTESLPGGIAVPDAALILTVYGSAEEERLGAAVLAADLNGDGRGDLIALSVDGDGPDGSRPDAGQVYVIFGR